MRQERGATAAGAAERWRTRWRGLLLVGAGALGLLAGVLAYRDWPGSPPQRLANGATDRPVMVAVQSAATSRVLVALRSGVILRSDDRGHTWQSSRTVDAPLVGMQCLPDATNCFAATAKGAILVTRDGFASAPQKLELGDRLLAMDANEGGAVIAAGDLGLWMRQGKTWQLLKEDRSRATVSSPGTVNPTTDGAARKKRLPPPTHTRPPLLADARVGERPNDSKATAVGDTVPAQASQRPKGTSPLPPGRKVAPPAEKTTPSEQTKTAQQPPEPPREQATPPAPLSRPSPTANARAIALSPNGQHLWILRDDALEHLEIVSGGLFRRGPIANVVPGGTHALSADDSSAYVVDDKGNVQACNAGGGCSTAAESARTQGVRRGQPTIRGNDLWVIARSADGETLLLSTDAGKHWSSPLLRSAPTATAPWNRSLLVYWILEAIVALLVGLSFIRLTPEKKITGSAAELLVSDRPIDDFGRDVLDLNQMALGLSRFLRNRQTQPSLTIGVTGEWGSGKSSLLNLLRRDLDRNMLMPVCFNAWHHEQEENVVAAMYSKIISQGLPRFPDVAAIVFRARLFWARRARLVGWLALLSLPLGLCLLLNPSGVIHALRHLLNAAPPEGHAELRNLSTDITLLLTALGVPAVLLSQLRAYGADPARLAAALAGSARVVDHRERISFHARFAAEFDEVTRALGSKRLVLIIDDLDRCSPTNILKVLESVNFLVSSGDCFVVMALSRSVVEQAVSRQIDYVAATAAKTEVTPEDRIAYARRYLEKLINIEVKVPRPTDAQTRALLTSRPEQDAVRAKQLARVRRAFEASAIARGALYGVKAAVIAALAFAISIQLVTLYNQAAKAPNTPDDQTSASIQASASGPAKQGQSDSNVLPAGNPLPQDHNVDGDKRTALDVSGLSVRTRWHIGLLMFVLVIAIIASASIKRGQELEDSPEFKTALENWHPLITKQNDTPRALKRFLNRVRYYAMRFQVPGSEDTDIHLTEDWLSRQIEKLLDRLEQTKEPVATQLAAPGRLPGDAWIVALALLEQKVSTLPNPESVYGELLEVAKLPGNLQTPELEQAFTSASLEPLGNRGTQLGIEFARVVSSVRV
jgi:KAP-like P-loop domain-containing protein